MTRDDLESSVRARAVGRCEYCLMQQQLQGATFHVEHILPESRGGLTELDNLAIACPSCNLHKSDRIEAIDPGSGATAPLFHPRTQRWSNHFQWDGYLVLGKTPMGRGDDCGLAAQFRASSVDSAR